MSDARHGRFGEQIKIGIILLVTLIVGPALLYFATRYTSARLTGIWLIYTLVLLVASGVSFFLFGFDKNRAISGSRRVPESTLLILACIGGWTGAIAGSRVFRHKTQKLSFRIPFWGCVVVHLAATAALFYFLPKS